jgi:hypothetical protein
MPMASNSTNNVYMQHNHTLEGGVPSSPKGCLSARLQGTFARLEMQAGNGVSHSAAEPCSLKNNKSLKYWYKLLPSYSCQFIIH